jgi:hypothetical protein
MSESAEQNGMKINLLAYRLSCIFRTLLHLQENNNIAADLLNKGTPKNEQTNPMDYYIPDPKPAISQLLATTAITLTTKPKFVVSLAQMLRPSFKRQHGVDYHY